MNSAVVLQFSTQNDPESWLIRAYSHGNWSHVDTVLEDGSLLGARDAGGVAIRPAGYAPFAATTRIVLPAPAAIVERYLGVVRTQLGKPYDRLAIAAFAFGRNWRDPEHWFCSELVGWGLEVSGFFPRPLPEEMSRITPENLRLLVSQFAAAMAA